MKKVFLVFVLSLFVCACSTQEIVQEQTVEMLYNNAMDEMEAENLPKAIKLFDEVERQHPYSKWSAKAQIMAAYLYYKQAKYNDAILVINRFLSLHPGNKYASYAHYLKGMCFYEQITDSERSQETTNQAYDTFNRLMVLYPDTDYAKDATGKVLLTINQMAGKEMAVGSYYLKQKKYAAALNRFADVVRNYANTEQI